MVFKALLIIVISSLAVDVMELFMFYKVYKTMESMYQEAVAKASIDLIRKA